MGTERHTGLEWAAVNTSQRIPLRKGQASVGPVFLMVAFMFLFGYHSDILVLLWFTRERGDLFVIQIIYIVFVSVLSSLCLFKIKLKK